MKIKRSQLQEGCILEKDIMLLGHYPLLKENTVIDKQWLEIIDAFLIDDLEVEDKLVTGEKFVVRAIPKAEDEDREIISTEKAFINFYLDAVQEYKKHFDLWKAGYHVSITDMQQILYPLIGKVINEPKYLLHFHFFGTKEDYLAHHAISVGVLSAYIAKKLNLSKKEWSQVGMAGVLADCGMAKLSPTLLQKTSELTSGEYELIKKHPVHGYKMLKESGGIAPEILLAVLQHHEREDGSGYPLSAPANKIHVFSQIIAVCDVYHALISDKVYKSKITPYEALEVLKNEEFGKFQLSVVKTLTETIMNFAIGSKVRLSNGQKAEIIFVDENHLSKPMVKDTETGDIINLKEKREITISHIL
ncbi:HD-GYP domain-containing protein [Alkalihalobacterium bogoriense]|uniref:HD-GYP domain-containing protein n=1 Tax=Alkalihalobacterium bogoriense TaxID=246272 RepID=UPI00047904E7|nr:HD-GYP domain-containing protein [Alkalihalobacterium bogoriense]